jgi:leucyl aminopeptidase
MLPQILKIEEFKVNTSTAIIFDQFEQLSHPILKEFNSDFLKERMGKGNECTVYNHPNVFYFQKTKEEDAVHLQIEASRKAGSKLFDIAKTEKEKNIQVVNFSKTELLPAFIEGLLLSDYSFDKYKKEKEDFHLEELLICDNEISSANLEELKNVVQSVHICRDLVNEPLSYLTAPQFSIEIEKLGKESGFTLEVFNKQKIEALKMGGLLAVNKGSIDPPTFNILEWKPENATNEKPVILVGKGIVYDTGGLSLKPTPKSMDFMKSDMAGAAVVATAIYAAAKNKLPVHVIGLIPATDNRPDGNAYVPGDIITMFDGTTVEVKNTDAEGRLVLADALSYAKKYSPELVIDVATLTGGAEIIAGNQAIVGMGNSEKYLKELKSVGENTYERIIEVPLWDEYAKPLKSPIADLNNLGGREAQTTVAGKFLEHFTDFNWIHLDTAPVSFFFEKNNYHPIGGTGFGTRLLFNFLKKFN